MKKFSIEKEEFVNKTFKISIDLLNRLNKICDIKNISMNKLVIKCIEYAIENSDLEQIQKDT